MFDQNPRLCPCGCDASYTFECEGGVAPRQGAWLSYTCPQSQDLLSFPNFGHWGPSLQNKKYKVVKASLAI